MSILKARTEIEELQIKEQQMIEKAAMQELDALEQRAANNGIRRLSDLMDAIGIAATAVVMGPGAVASIASHLKYSKNTVKKLAAMHDLPEDCIDLCLKPGTYWAILLYADEAGIAPVEFIRNHAIPEQMTPAEAKRAMGIEVIRESALDKLNEELDTLRQERQEIESLISEIHSFGDNLIGGVKTLLMRLRKAEGQYDYN
jgi:hypothetical protein